jgi:hypothetical protein
VSFGFFMVGLISSLAACAIAVYNWYYSDTAVLLPVVIGPKVHVEPTVFVPRETAPRPVLSAVRLLSLCFVDMC